MVRLLKWLFIFLPVSMLYGQGLSPSIGVTGSFYPTRNLQDTSGSYSHQRMNVKLMVPLLKGFNLRQEEFRFYMISLSANTSIDKTNISVPALHTLFFTGSISVNGLYRTSKKSMWFGTVAASSFEDENTIHQPSLRVSGLALYRRSPGEHFFYMLGGAYNFSFGRGLPLPVLGAGWHFTNHSSLTLILPLMVSYQFGKRSYPYTLFIKPNGGVSNFSNNGLYANGPETMVFRRREFNVGIKKKFKLSDRWTFYGETGLVVGRKLFFANDYSRESSATVFESKVQAGPYVSLGIHYRFKKKVKTETPLYDEQDIDYINDL